MSSNAPYGQSAASAAGVAQSPLPRPAEAVDNRAYGPRNPENVE